MIDRLCIRQARVYGRPQDQFFDVLIERSCIKSVVSELEIPAGADVIEAQGQVLIPGFVDCHTHACFAGSRLEEWQQKLAGADYLELLSQGGGIMSTVRATRKATEDELTELLLHRLMRMLKHGSTTIEVKSGYGLDTESELKMLRSIDRAARQFPGSVIATACIGHAIDPEVEHDRFVRRTIRETLPAVTAEFPGIALDAYCEQGAWSLSECLQLCEAGQKAGHPIRMHADQFNALGMIEAAVERGFVSVDHLEASRPEGLQTLAGSDTFGVMLPASGFHLNDQYGDGRAFLDAGGKLALASNYNPGSAPCYSMPFVIQLAVRKLGLTIDEALHASTQAAADVLGLSDRGRIEVGQRADLILLDETDVRTLAFEFGGHAIRQVICNGRLI